MSTNEKNADKLQVADKGIGADFILNYYKERYEEAKSSYRRLEDKVNYLLAVLGLEMSALLAIFGSIELNAQKPSSVFIKLAILCLCMCIISLIISFVYLWNSWSLKGIPKMVAHRKKEEHDFLLEGSREATLRYHMMMYGMAVGQIDTLHGEKARHVTNLFKSIALSFAFFILSVFFILIDKV